ncbi:E3 ubiquitin-protein ligase SPL11 [Symbiodinium microadriaticum]|uniref:E3 ubiquitin-protein ligase SPL11 n=1 Tax=Symbiodinium microadriaticum TaxID=2951 RepID=A0A1Q9D0M3_SYMMI|nr:E3 ubiquitin-protein ligase SPL11 [Symbiodinium microadriaticum]
MVLELAACGSLAAGNVWLLYRCLFARHYYAWQLESAEDIQAMVLPSFRCPISQEVMREPVVTSDGQTYERCNIEAKDTYAPIKENMKPFVEKQGKPRIRAMEAGERLHFFNTLHNKYHMKAGGKNLEWNVSKQTHRSTKNELNWILSNYFRTDSHAVLKGAGHD